MWHQFTLHALTYCRLCKDAGTCRAPLMVPEPRLRYGQSGLKRQSPRVPPPGSTLIIRSYQGENTGSHPNSEVKHPWACSVLRWGTTRESQVTNVFVWKFGIASVTFANRFSSAPSLSPTPPQSIFDSRAPPTLVDRQVTVSSVCDAHPCEYLTVGFISCDKRLVVSHPRRPAVLQYRGHDPTWCKHQRPGTA